MRRYDSAQQRLVYLTGGASSEEWDEHWSAMDFERLFAKGRNDWLVRQTQQYLPAGSRVLEGGCGCADKVYALMRSGYMAIGFDTAARTLHRARQACGDLLVSVADIRRFPLADGAMDGYWSLGVFEHFIDGMEPHWREAARVTREDGLLFLTMPIMSPLRRLKATLGMYPQLGEFASGDFYQYAYSPAEVVRIAQRSGFRLLKYQLIDGVKGVKDELPWLRPVLQRAYSSHHALARIFVRVMDVFARRFAGHVGYFVFRRTGIGPGSTHSRQATAP